MDNLPKWHDIPELCKRRIFSYLDFEDRVALRFISINDRKIIDSIPFEAKCIGLERSSVFKQGRVVVDGKNTLIFIKLFSGSSKFMKDGRYIRYGDTIDGPAQTFQKLMEHRHSKTHFLKILDFKAEWLNRSEKLDVKHLMLDFTKNEPEEVSNWMDRIKGLECLTINLMGHTLFKGMAQLSPKLAHFPYVRINVETDCSNHDMLRLKATNLKLISCNINTTGVHHLIRSWLKRDVPEGSRFDLELPSVSFDRINLVTQGLEKTTMRKKNRLYDVVYMTDVNKVMVIKKKASKVFCRVWNIEDLTKFMENYKAH